VFPLLLLRRLPTSPIFCSKKPVMPLFAFDPSPLFALGLLDCSNESARLQNLTQGTAPALQNRATRIVFSSSLSGCF
jgi:hypothetical protein